jgi:small-conductance mechanosensitive channel
MKKYILVALAVYGVSAEAVSRQLSAAEHAKLKTLHTKAIAALGDRDVTKHDRLVIKRARVRCGNQVNPQLTQAERARLRALHTKLVQKIGDVNAREHDRLVAKQARLHCHMHKKTARHAKVATQRKHVQHRKHVKKQAAQ